MKRFTILLTSLIGVVVFLLVFQARTDGRAEAKKASTLPRVYDATGAMLEAINAESTDLRVAPVYDSTGAMLEAINPDKKVMTSPAYDATGAMLDAINP